MSIVNPALCLGLGWSYLRLADVSGFEMVHAEGMSEAFGGKRVGRKSRFLGVLGMGKCTATRMFWLRKPLEIMGKPILNGFFNR